MNHVYLALGSNLGNKSENIKEALFRIETQIGEVVASSNIYETTPQGFISDQMFANSACHVLTDLSLSELFAATQTIEKDMGRTQKSANHTYSDRLIDIDILLFNSHIATTGDLILPHPQMHKRSFVLDPLAEIAADIYHPSLHKTIAELKAEFDKEMDNL